MPLQEPAAAAAIIKRVIAQMESKDGWCHSAASARLANLVSDFDPRTYGFRKLSDLVRRTGAFELGRAEGKPMRVRAKPQAGRKKR
jgi:hypothetical protein